MVHHNMLLLHQPICADRSTGGIADDRPHQRLLRGSFREDLFTLF